MTCEAEKYRAIARRLADNLQENGVYSTVLLTHRLDAAYHKQALDACGREDVDALEFLLEEGCVRGDWRRAAVRRRLDELQALRRETETGFVASAKSEGG